jgi:hypothetical protein
VAQTFETALKAAVASRPPRKGFWAKRLQKLLDAPPSERRTKILARLERHVRAELVEQSVAGADSVGFDWASVDWAKVLDIVLKLVLLLLPLFLGKPPAGKRKP